MKSIVAVGVAIGLVATLPAREVRAGGPPVTTLKNIVSVGAVKSQCGRHLHMGHVVNVRGYLLTFITFAGFQSAGALFPTDEIPVSAPYGNGIERFGGVHASLANVSSVMYLSAYGGWAVLQANLVCRPHIYLSVYGARHARPPSRRATIPSIPGVVRPTGIGAICSTDVPRYRVRVRGLFRQSDSGVDPSAGYMRGLTVATSAHTPRTSRPIPADRIVTVYGLLMCRSSPPLLEEYSWM